ncbi:MAG TPA: hypothetical protein PLF11_16450 [Bacillota bacterium]|jgi:hypothetical protein|nr:hypothetical protein [Bacillota bacterium]
MNDSEIDLMNHEEHYKTVCEPAFRRIETGQKELARKFEELIGLMRGSNGTPGVLQRVDRIEERQNDHETRIQGQHHTLYGLNREPGLVDDMREQQRRQERTAKILWTALSAVVIQAAVWVRGLFTGG